MVVVAVVRGLEKRRTILGSPSQNRGRRRMLLLLRGPRPPAAAPGTRPLRRGLPRPRPLRRQRRRRQMHPCQGQTARRGRKKLARTTSSSSSSKIDPWLARTAAEGAAGTAAALSLLSILAECPREGGAGGFDQKVTAVVALPKIFKRRAATSSTAAATTEGRRPAAFRPRRLRDPRAAVALRRTAGSKATRGRATAAPTHILQAAVRATTPTNGPGNLVLAGSLRGWDGEEQEGEGLGKEGANTTTIATAARRKSGMAIVDVQATTATADFRTRTIAAEGTFPAGGKGAGLVGEGEGGVGGGGGLTAGATTEAIAEKSRWTEACLFVDGHEAAPMSRVLRQQSPAAVFTFGPKCTRVHVSSKVVLRRVLGGCSQAGRHMLMPFFLR